MTSTLRALAIGALAMSASAAAAQNVDMRFLDTGAGKGVKIWSDGYDGNVFAGQLIHEIDAGDSDLTGIYTTYCIDVHDFVTSRFKTYQVSNLADAPDAHTMGEDTAQALRDLYAYADGAQLAADASNTFAAAFQIAVWEIVEDYDASVGIASLDITSGSFKASKTNGRRLRGSFTNYLSDLFGSIGSGARNPGLIALTSDRYQDQIIQTTIPAPTTLAAFSLLGAGAMRRRRRA